MGIENFLGQSQAPSSAQEKPQPQKFSKEWLDSRSTLELEAHADLGPVLASLNERLGAQLAPRPDGFHITIIGPTESKVLKEMTPEQLNRLQEISQKIQDGSGITVAGIGLIDGASAPGGREADKAKKTAFVALDIPELNEFREQLGLPRKDFHITIGFEGGDIHQRITGSETDAKGKKKDVLGPVPKQADPAFDDLRETLGDIRFGGIEGQAKQEKQAKK